MKKRILLVYTGGTIGSAYDEKTQCRVLAANKSNMTLLKKFMEKTHMTQEESEDLFDDSLLEKKDRTLSENMTYSKLNIIIDNIIQKDHNEYCGIIVLHGTDTLAYTSSLFSFIFSDTKIPVMLVSGNKPPEDETSNANANFQTAVKLILEGIAPNVYVTYRNSDNNMWLYLGTAIKQSSNYSDDFYGASDKKSFCLSNNNLNINQVFECCSEFSKKRKKLPFKLQETLTLLEEGVLLISPYTGMNYSHYNLDGVKAIVHGSYHSGTVCVERNTEEEEYHSQSLLWLASECEKREPHIPIFVAPSKLDYKQYLSVLDLAKNSSVKLLDMTTEAAYTKLLLGMSCGCGNEEICGFMYDEICNEMMN